MRFQVNSGRRRKAGKPCPHGRGAPPDFIAPAGSPRCDGRGGYAGSSGRCCCRPGGRTELDRGPISRGFSTGEGGREPVNVKVRLLDYPSDLRAELELLLEALPPEECE
jgi:hypothetical protein